MITPDGILEQIERPDRPARRQIPAKDIVGETATGLAAGTPLTFSLKTLTWSAAAFEAAMVASAIVMATSEQDLACSGFLRVSFMIYLVFDCFCFGLRGN